MPNKYIDLFKEMIPALDAGIKEMWDAAEEDGQKDIKGDLWNLNRYMSSVKGSRDKQELAVFKTNEYYNKNWNELGMKHPKLQWQLICLAGNSKKIEFHQWIGFKKKTGGNGNGVKLLQKIYPNMKEDEIELLANLSTKKELKQLAKEHDIEIKL